MVICLERGANLHTAQLMPLPLTVCCFSKIQIGFTFLVPAHLGSPGQRAVKRVCVCHSMYTLPAEMIERCRVEVAGRRHFDAEVVALFVCILAALGRERVCNTDVANAD